MEAEPPPQSPSTEHRHGLANRLLERYGTLLVVLVVQLVLVAFLPSRDDTTSTTLADAAGIGAPDTTSEAVVGDVGTGPGSTATTGNAPGTGPAGDRPTPDASGCLGGVCGLGSNGLATGLGSNDPGTWPWAQSWRLTGDRSRCAPGGQLQDAVLNESPPCTPRFDGDNGGSTYRGVTKDEIVGVIFLQHYSDAERQLLSGADLDASVAEWDAAVQAFAKFFNKHYEFYGRRLRLITVQGECSATSVDPTCYRNAAKQLVAKYQPFFVTMHSDKPPEFFDELSRAGVINWEGWMYSDSFSTARRPYHWDVVMSGNKVATMVSSYWCSKMEGRPAARAGDPLLQRETRKLGIVATESPAQAEGGRQLVAAVSGGRCGSPSEKPPVLTYDPNDQAGQQNRAVAVATTFRQQGVTTVACFCDLSFPVFMTRAFDSQNYFPEHLLSSSVGVDHDYIGRLYSSAQWENAFGPSSRPMELPAEKTDSVLAWRDVGKAGQPKYATLGALIALRPIAMMLQWAGPRLTPETFERGAFEGPQIGGYTNANPWPGWVCCRPGVEMWKWSPDNYTGQGDAKEVYWSSTARSQIDGKPGTYLCARGCERRPIDVWTAADPLQ